MNLQQPIEIQFKSQKDTNCEVQRIVLTQINDMVKAAQGDLERLKDLHRMFKEGAWLTGNLIDQIKANS